ncbi:hypothetical protein ACEN33_00695 [Ruoffia sp. FAM 24228]|uniref:hypothetical protein n=1 Tax=Ruoffia sp. FAM 24228 TaxID=3259517 RepID=UPI0038842949
MLKLLDAKKIDKSITQDDIDALEQKVRTLTNNKFHHKHIKNRNLSFFDNGIITADEIIGFKVGDRVEIVGTKFNDGLYNIISVSKNILTVDSEFIDSTDRGAFVVKIDYPVDIANSLKEIIRYQAKMANKTGVKTERVSRTSVTYHDVNSSDNVEGIPSSYWSFIRKYRKIRW